MLSEFSPRRTSRLSRVHIVRFAKFGATAPATIEAYGPVAVQHGVSARGLVAPCGAARLYARSLGGFDVALVANKRGDGAFELARPVA